MIKLFDVGSCAESLLTRSGNNYHADFGILVVLQSIGIHDPSHFRRHRVQFLRPIQRDDGDVISEIEQDFLVLWHGK